MQEFLSIKKTKSEGWKCDVSSTSVALFFHVDNKLFCDLNAEVKSICFCEISASFLSINFFFMCEFRG